MPIPPEAFVLPPAGRGTLQQRLRQLVSEGVLSGRFAAGQKMPSSRGLADHLAISRITVTLAYAELVSADYLTSKGRSGYFVSETAPRAPEPPPSTSSRAAPLPVRRSEKGAANVAGCARAHAGVHDSGERAPLAPPTRTGH